MTEQDLQQVFKFRVFSPAGKISSADFTGCVDCPLGLFAPQPGTTACQACSIGRSASIKLTHVLNMDLFLGKFVGSPGATQCQDTPPGTYCNIPGSSSAFLCPPGRSSRDRASTYCEACAVGLYSTLLGATSCSKCNPRFYAADRGLSSCQECPIGSQSTVDTVGCTCPKGRLNFTIKQLISSFPM